jgi:hypothetical protein
MTGWPTLGPLRLESQHSLCRYFTGHSLLRRGQTWLHNELSADICRTFPLFSPGLGLILRSFARTGRRFIA